MLSEWGTVDRFGESTLIDSHADFVAKGWFVPSDDSAAADYFNQNNFETDAQVTSWFANSGSSAAYEHYIPVGTTRVVVAFAGSDQTGNNDNILTCNASIYEHSGTEVYSRTRQGEGLSSFPDPDVVAVDTSAGPARIRFDESGGNMCWTAYVLISPPPPLAALALGAAHGAAPARAAAVQRAVHKPSVRHCAMDAGGGHLNLRMGSHPSANHCWIQLLSSRIRLLPHPNVIQRVQAQHRA